MRHRMSAPLALLFAVGLLTGCVAIQIGIYPGFNFPPTDPATVQIYRSFPPDSDTYEVIGEFSVQEALGDYDSLFYQRLKRRVAEVGGNAVILQRSLEGVVAFTIPGQASSTTTAVGTATATAFGNNAVATGATASHTSATYTPPQKLEVGSYSGRGYVIRFKSKP